MRTRRVEILVEGGASSPSEVAVSITVFNYENFVLDALESVRSQTLEDLDLIVIDDASKDDSVAVVEQWLQEEGRRFHRYQLARHTQNFGLAAVRNTAFELARTDFVFVLDADNELYPRCLERCLESVRAPDAAFAYPTLEIFGRRSGLLSAENWNLEWLKNGNYIDAMALVSVAAWRRVGGYSKMSITGWEDYDFWCKLAESGYHGIRVPEILARYRDHSRSMLSTITNHRLMDVKREMQRRHPWLHLLSPLPAAE